MIGEEAVGAIEELLGPAPAPVHEIILQSGAGSSGAKMAPLQLDLAGRGWNVMPAARSAFAPLDDENLPPPPYAYA